MKNTKLIKFVKSVAMLKLSFYFFDAFNKQHNKNIITFIRSLCWYFKDYAAYRSLKKNEPFLDSTSNLLPQIADKTANNPIDHIYILQNAWACKKIFKNKPKEHIDIASSIGAVAIMSQFVPTTVVDIRKVDLKLNNLRFIKGSILELPFKDSSVESISSICVVEHIGLGRYGDPIDQFGSEKAIMELLRVTKKGGSIILSVPVGKENRVLFNAHREFIPAYFISLLSNCKLMDKQFIVGNTIKSNFTKQDENVVGLFEFKKL